MIPVQPERAAAAGSRIASLALEPEETRAGAEMTMTIRHTTSLTVFACLFSLASAGASAAANDRADGQEARECPMLDGDTTVTAQDVEGGAALVFTTAGDVEELRQRVAHMAEMHNRRSDAGGHMMMGGRGMGGGMMGRGMMMGGMTMPSSQARVSPIEGGAILTYTARDPGELAALREQVRQHAAAMQAGECPMMMMMMMSMPAMQLSPRSGVVEPREQEGEPHHAE